MQPKQEVRGRKRKRKKNLQESTSEGMGTRRIMTCHPIIGGKERNLKHTQRGGKRAGNCNLGGIRENQKETMSLQSNIEK